MEDCLQEDPELESPGPDGIQEFWLTRLRALLRAVLEGTLEVPQWMVSGRTVMIPKEDCKGESGQFRPITCLNTSYKLLTGTQAVTSHNTRIVRVSYPPSKKQEKEVTEVVWMLSLLMQRSQGDHVI